MKLKLEGKNIFYFGFLEAASRISIYEKKKIKEAGFDVTPKMLRYISLISSHPKIKQSELMTVLDITKGTLSNMLKSLILKGYIIKKLGNEDKRIHVLTLTPKGEKLSILNDEIRSNIKKKILSRINQDEFDKFVSTVLKMR